MLFFINLEKNFSHYSLIYFFCSFLPFFSSMDSNYSCQMVCYYPTDIRHFFLIFLLFFFLFPVSKSEISFSAIASQLKIPKTKPSFCISFLAFPYFSIYRFHLSVEILYPVLHLGHLWDWFY